MRGGDALLLTALSEADPRLLPRRSPRARGLSASKQGRYWDAANRQPRDGELPGRERNTDFQSVLHRSQAQRCRQRAPVGYHRARRVSPAPNVTEWQRGVKLHLTTYHLT
ncbi:hypothetical protein NDU88_001515 [Pleurodeles waltl]|uniref:Uncharacterized protein n=1 Tax=Pleurodeles waltl TaxID=8319 RepID=A0AAV7KWG7_PLEWA|nr:hypothetical protein NDU88_001515 [Pleurodeles waltl]